MVIKLDFGESYSHHMPVIELIKERLPISMQLSLISIFITYIIAIPLGVFSAVHQYKLSDKIITVTLFILYSLPSFWVANMFILFTTGGDFPNIFPTRFLHSPGAENLTFIKWMLDWIWHLVLPITCLTYASFAYVSRQMRVGMLDIIRQDFIRTARAKGLSERAVIFKHALRNALIPTVTLLAFLLPALLGGSIIIEEIFTIEGMGKLSFEAILNRDYPIINAIAFFSAFLTLIGMLCSDIAYVLVDPRINFNNE
ncbi:ABC transporter permease [bacterium]|nr:ABC transporter permease [bacterium]